MHHDELATNLKSDTEPPGSAPHQSDSYIRIGPGSWQHVGAVAHRVVGRLFVEGGQ